MRENTALSSDRAARTRDPTRSSVLLQSALPARDGPEAWRVALREAVRDPDELIRILELPESLREPARKVAGLFPLLAPRSFVARMRPGDPADPLLLQVLPLGAEETQAEGDLADPVADGAATVIPGLLRKYEGRALLIAAGACAVHCRYCFRRHFPYHDAPKGLEAWRPALARIASDTTLKEVILSGGDPLVLGDEALRDLVEAVAAAPHVERLRVHTRLPVVIPERVTEALPRILRSTRLSPVVVIHANHPAELEAGNSQAVGRLEATGCTEAIGRLVDAGIPVLNQAVLLRGVNDDADVLARLCERLVGLRVLPYYLPPLARGRGAAHFAVDEGRGREIVGELRRRLPGYAVPRYVREVPGERSKVPVGG